MRHEFWIWLLFVLGANMANGAEFEMPFTEHGVADFQGVWNFSTSTPLERPAQYGQAEFLEPFEIDELEQQRKSNYARYNEREQNVSSRILNNSSARSVGSVNFFWQELQPLRENPRTSLITHPANGKLPPVLSGVVVQNGDASGVREIPGQRPVRYTHGGIGKNGPEDRGLSERCLVFNSGPPLLSGPYNNNIQIIQNKDHVVVLTEMGFDARIVPLNSKPLLDGAITSWSGDSRGYINGNTLVVETRNFSSMVASLGLRGIAYGSAKNRLLTERFTRTEVGVMEYEFTIDDPDTFTDKIVAKIPMTKTNGKLYEYACHAGNYAIGHILAGARVAEEEPGN